MRVSLRVLTALCSLAAAAPATEAFLFQHENVVGTTFELRVLADSEHAAQRAESIALAEIDRLAAIFSTYDAESEFSRWQAQATDFTPISPELWAVLSAADKWRETTGGAFHPGAEVIVELWQKAASHGHVPSADERAAAVSLLQSPPWALDASGRRARRVGRYPLSLNAIAKGSIIDRVAEAVLQQPGVTAALVKIGGDLRIAGDWEQPVAIRDPQEAGDNVTPRRQVWLRDRALATSGDRFRSVEIAGRRYSHVVDPRAGSTADHVQSASVIAPTTMDADALATACCVQTVAESLSLIDRLPETACLIVDAEGRHHASRSWSALERPESLLAFAQADGAASQSDKPVAAWNGGFELQVDFALNQPDGGAYRRPYVACWVEDAAGKSVRTIVLWVQNTGAGPRWIPDLHRWYRKDFQRRQSEKINLVATVSEPTRKAGTYKLVWDGVDDHGQLVPAGKYTVFLEVNRERGTYQLMRKEAMFADQPFRVKFDDNPEIKAAALDYRRRPAPSSGP
jgi:thiamine biosynthesis lipoprotein ApbE